MEPNLPRLVLPDSAVSLVHDSLVPYFVEGWWQYHKLGMSEFSPNWFRVGPKWTNLGLFKISFQFVLAFGVEPKFGHIGLKRDKSEAF